MHLNYILCFFILYFLWFSTLYICTFLSEKTPYLIFTDDDFDRLYKCTSGIPSYVNKVLLALYDYNEVSIDFLTKKTYMSKSSVTKAVKHLEKKGLVNKKNR